MTHSQLQESGTKHHPCITRRNQVPKVDRMYPETKGPQARPSNTRTLAWGTSFWFAGHGGPRDSLKLYITDAFLNHFLGIEGKTLLLKIPSIWDIGLREFGIDVILKPPSWGLAFRILLGSIEAAKRGTQSIMMPINHQVTNMIGCPKGGNSGTHLVIDGLSLDLNHGLLNREILPVTRTLTNYPWLLRSWILWHSLLLTLY